MRTGLALLCITAATLADAEGLQAYLACAGDNAGIHRIVFDPDEGNIALAERVADGPNPFFLGASSDGRFLYATCRDDSLGERSGIFQSYSISPDNGSLLLLEEVPTEGSIPVHFTIAPKGRFAAVSHYLTPTVLTLPLHPDGSLGTLTVPQTLEGSSIHPQRQSHSYPHSITFHPSSRFAYVCDRGSDRIATFAVDPITGQLASANPAYARLRPGAGPRHMAFHPDQKRAYVINEINGSITELTIDSKTGAVQEGPSYPTLPETFLGENFSAEVAVHPNGKTIYASNRGHDSIAVFAVGEGVELKRIQIVPSGGQHPRHFTIDPTGNWLLVSNRHSDRISVFRISLETGRLDSTDNDLLISQPLHLVFRK